MPFNGSFLFMESMSASDVKSVVDDGNLLLTFQFQIALMMEGQDEYMAPNSPAADPGRFRPLSLILMR
jgi:hypothetical protein